MSSIAYVTNEKMLEYHRLCRNRSILFWRLTTKNRFTDFRKGDLLFFFAKGNQYRKKKALIGYGHYAYTKKLSVNQMWREYGNMTGFDTKLQLEDAITKAAKGDIPEKMLCLYLTDVVFFTSPINPKDVGIDIPAKLESYCYIDRDDPQVTVRILKKAEKYGIDIWSYDDSQSPEEIFSNDEIRHILALAHHDMGKELGNQREQIAAHKLVKNQVKEKNFEMIRNSKTDCVSISKNEITIAIPFTYGATDKQARLRDWLGRATLYRLYLQRNQICHRLKFIALMDEPNEEMDLLVKELDR